MINRISLLVFFLLLNLPGFNYNLNASNNYPPAVLYLHPIPNSEYVSRQTTLLLRFKPEYRVTGEDLQNLFTVNGDLHGDYSGKTFFSDDSLTIIFKADESFEAAENITVTLQSKYFEPNRFTYQFKISEISNLQAQNINNHILNKQVPQKKVNGTGTVRTINGVTVPSDFPEIEIRVNNENTAPGRIFTSANGNYFMILENDGTPYFYQKAIHVLMDFKVQSDEYLSRSMYDPVYGKNYYIIMDKNFNNVDTVAAKHGYDTDFHEFILLPNGHSLLICSDGQFMDLSKIVEDGKPEAMVIGYHFQELDSNKNVVFEWRCWDYLNIAESTYDDLTYETVDFPHMNSIAVDYDGHYLISCRHLSQCFKINHLTGEIIWRLGGIKNSFEFINDSDEFSFQHMFQPVPGKNNHYTLFDNGDDHETPKSRGVEFKLNLQEMTAEKVWDFAYTPNIFSCSCGSVQRLPNENSLICWGWGGEDFPFATEISPDGEVVYDACFSDISLSYRSFRFDWEGIADRPYLLVENQDDRLTLIFNQFGDRSVDYYKIYFGSSEKEMVLLDTTSTTRYDYFVQESIAHYFFKVNAVDKQGNEGLPSNIVETTIRIINPGEEIIKNGGFYLEDIFWELETLNGIDANGKVVDDVYQLTKNTTRKNYSDVQLIQKEIPLFYNKTYKWEFDAWCLGSRSRIIPEFRKSNNSRSIYGTMFVVQLNKQLQHFSFGFEMTEDTDLDAQLVFNCGLDTGTIYLDNISMKMIDPLDVEQTSNELPELYELEQNYPNPFNSITRITYLNPQKANVELTVFDTLGRTVWSKEEILVAPGKHSVLFDASHLPSGIYYYRLSMENPANRTRFSKTKKMVYLK